jgi:hypothetical protein
MRRCMTQGVSMATALKSIVGEGVAAEGSGTDVSKNWENDRFAYGQLCDSYRAIDDFRSKLLTLLPIGTGIFLVLPDLAKELATPGRRVSPRRRTLPRTSFKFSLRQSACSGWPS